jgi:hypothetical protein
MKKRIKLFLVSSTVTIERLALECGRTSEVEAALVSGSRDDIAKNDK